MARAMWSGSISFGLVNVPVKLYSAARNQDVRFNQIHAEDGGRIRMKRVCEADGEEVPYDEIVKGYEVGPDQYVKIAPEELDALAPSVTEGIEIEEFVDLSDIDPVFFENSYYLAPDKGGVKAYALLLNAMRESNKIAIGRVVLRQKQYLVALRPAGDALSMATLYYPDEVVEQEAIDGLPKEMPEVSERELSMAQQLIETLSTQFEPGKYHDEYRERVMELIEKKASGQEVVIAEREEKPKRVVDLMAALEASIAAAKGDQPKGKASKAKPESRDEESVEERREEQKRRKKSA
jgi:DNA end-binding protein Ku